MYVEVTFNLPCYVKRTRNNSHHTNTRHNHTISHRKLFTYYVIIIIIFKIINISISGHLLEIAHWNSLVPVAGHWVRAPSDLVPRPGVSLRCRVSLDFVLRGCRITCRRLKACRALVGRVISGGLVALGARRRS